METFAYDHGLPCRNPSCKSNGKPHPNCNCYAQAAEGGKIGSRCETNQAHDKGCEYFVDGGVVGEVPADDIPQAEINSPETPDSSNKVVQEQAMSGEVPKNDLPDQTEVPTSDLPSSEKYGTPGQQAITALEGTAQGYLGPVATLAEKGLNKLGVPGVTDEDIAGRQEANPGIHATAEAAGLLTGALTGTGEVGLIAKMLPEVKVLGKFGSAIVKGALETGAIQGGDEISKAMLGQGDPEAPVSSAIAHMGAAALLGGTAGGVFNVTGWAGVKGLEALENAKLGARAKNILKGMGLAAKMREQGIPLENAESFIDDLNTGMQNANPHKEFFNSLKPRKPATSIPELFDEELDYKDLKPGIEMYSTGLKKAAGESAQAVGWYMGGYPGAKIAEKLLAPIAEKVMDKAVTKGTKYVVPAMIKSMSEGRLDKLLTTLDYASKVSKGANAINNGLDGLFKVGGQRLLDYEISDRDREKLHETIEKGGVNSQIQNSLDQSPSPDQRYAEGGEITPQSDDFSQVFPEHAMMLSATKGRVYNYLNSQRPQPPVGKLPYDAYTPDPMQEKSYNKALDIANQPLSVLNHIKRGELSLDNLKHFSGMYPELYSHLSKKITDRIVNNQVNDEKPDYKMRQSLSLFLGAPMDSTLKPSNIQAAQATYIPPQQPQQPPNAKKSRKGTSTLGKSNSSFKTQTQAAESDRSSRD